MADLKHVGRVISTKQRVLVAYRTLPGDSGHCLVIPTDSLSDSYHNSIINLVEGQAAQDANEFAEVLMRSTFTDGSNMLVWLHNNGRLLKMGTSSIEMVPSPAVSVQLSELNQIIAEQRGVAVDDLAVNPNFEERDSAAVKEVAKLKEATPVANDAAKTTSASINSDATPTAEIVDVAVAGPNDSPEATAKMYRSQADKLAKEAAHFRRLAENLVPTKKKA
jgi:hypothetical protein